MSTPARAQQAQRAIGLAVVIDLVLVWGGRQADAWEAWPLAAAQLAALGASSLALGLALRARSPSLGLVASGAWLVAVLRWLASWLDPLADLWGWWLRQIYLWWYV